MVDTSMMQCCSLCQITESSKSTMDVPEFAQVMGISRGKAYELAARDELPVKVIRLGKRVLLSRAEVHNLVHAQ